MTVQHWFEPSLRRFCVAFALLFVVEVSFRALQAQEASGVEKSRTQLAVEALSRLENIDLSANPKLQEAVDRVLGQVRGTPDFVRLVKKFQLKDQASGLLEMAQARGGDETGGEAARLLLSDGQRASIEQALSGTNVTAVTRLVEALGGAGDGRAVALLTPLLSSKSRDIAVRKQIVKALARYHDGASELVKLATEDKLGNDLVFVARSELSGVRWPEIKSAAAKALPAPQTGGSEPLPPMAELIQRKGDAAHGKELFALKATCASCHQVNGQGVNFGPDLTQVGTKLGKDALYESILEPSAGIAFGYEAWLLTLKTDDEVFGLIASETETEITLKAPGGVLSSYRKSDVVKRDKQALSVMPAGLQALLNTRELVDLVEYLSSLKKPN